MPESIRVVLADDHALLREGARELLEQQPDIEVVGEAGDGVEAVAVVERVRPDIVILDIAMPELNGIEAARQIKTSCPAVAVLVLSMHDDDEYVVQALAAGADAYLLKDVRGVELIDTIRTVNAGEWVLHPAIAKKVLDRFRSGNPATDPSPLTERELGVLKLAAGGLTNKAIGNELGLSSRTVQAHLGHVFEKLGVRSRTEAVLEGLRRGWLRLEGLE